MQNVSFSARPAVAEDIEFMPNISTAKPARIIPMVFFLSDLVNIMRITPMTARTGVNVVGLRRFRKLNPSEPLID